MLKMSKYKCYSKLNNYSKEKMKIAKDSKDNLINNKIKRRKDENMCKLLLRMGKIIKMKNEVEELKLKYMFFQRLRTSKEKPTIHKNNMEATTLPVAIKKQSSINKIRDVNPRFSMGARTMSGRSNKKEEIELQCQILLQRNKALEIQLGKAKKLVKNWRDYITIPNLN